MFLHYWDYLCSNKKKFCYIPKACHFVKFDPLDFQFRKFKYHIFNENQNFKFRKFSFFLSYPDISEPAIGI